MPTKTATEDPKSKADAADPKAKSDTTAVDTAPDPVATATQKLADAQAELAKAQAEHAEAVEAAKPKIGRFDPKKPTIVIEGNGEQAVSPDAFSDKENGHDF